MCSCIYYLCKYLSLRSKFQIWLVSVGLQESALFLPLLSSFPPSRTNIGLFGADLFPALKWLSANKQNFTGSWYILLLPFSKRGKVFLISSLPLKKPHDPFGSLPPEKRSHSSRMTRTSNLCPERTFSWNYIPNPPFTLPKHSTYPDITELQNPRSNNKRQRNFHPLWTQLFFFFPREKPQLSYHMSMSPLHTDKSKTL